MRIKVQLKCDMSYYNFTKSLNPEQDMKMFPLKEKFSGTYPLQKFLNIS